MDSEDKYFAREFGEVRERCSTSMRRLFGVPGVAAVSCLRSISRFDYTA